MKKIITLTLMAAMLISLLAGCGDKTPEATHGNDPVNTTSSQQTTTPTEQATEPVPVAEVSEDDFIYNPVGDDTCEITGCTAKASVIAVPETIKGYKVVGIGQYGFGGVPAEKVELPDSVEYLAMFAFVNCDNLKEIDLGDGLKRVALLSFNTCSALESLTFPDGMEEISDVCFGACEALKEVYVPASVTSIPVGIADLPACPNIVIVTPAGSTAEASAQEFGLPVRNP